MTTRNPGARTVAGIDGCRGGWIVAWSPRERPERTRVEVVADLGDVVVELDAGRLAVAAIDIPIGLPDRSPRRADVDARRLLGPRRSSVFPTPPRCVVLGALTYQQACDRSRAACGKALSKQLYNIVPKIREVDALQTPVRQRRLVEMCPELSLAVLAGSPMLHPKSTAAGRDERMGVLAKVFGAALVARLAARPPAGARADDVLDALAGAWTARRVAAGAHVRLGGDRDERGLRMEVNA